MHIPSLLRPSAALVTKTVRRARAGTAMAAPFSAPRTSFNGTITRRRTIAFADMPLDEVRALKAATGATVNDVVRSEEHTSELQSLMRLSYAVFCLNQTKH